MTDTARFYIDVPLDKLDRVEHILNSEDVPFCTTENMVHLPRENLLDSIFTGADGQYAIDKLNSHHRRRGTPRAYHHRVLADASQDPERLPGVRHHEDGMGERARTGHHPRRSRTLRRIPSATPGSRGPTCTTRPKGKAHNSESGHTGRDELTALHHRPRLHPRKR